MRKREIKPGFFLNEDLSDIPPLGRLLFAGMWVIADKEGRLEDRPRKIKAEVMPYDDFDAEEMVQALADKGFIVRYEVDGMRYIQVVNWLKHQSPHPKETASNIPPVENRLESNGNYIAGNGNSVAGNLKGDDEQRTSNPIPSFTSYTSSTESIVPADTVTVDDEWPAKQPAKQTKKKREPVFEPIHKELAQHLREKIMANKPDFHFGSSVEQWADTIRLMTDCDKRNPVTIRAVIDWCQQDDFWKGNILSADKLRKQFDKLEIRMNGDSQKQLPRAFATLYS